MKSPIWPMVGVALVCMAIGLPAAAQAPHGGPGEQEPQDPNAGQGSSPLRSRDEVRQSEPPRQGYYQDIPRRGPWQAGGPAQRHGAQWPGGHGNGWGPGPRYQPGQAIDRFPERYWRVPYQGRDYFYSGGYWFQPHGPSYVVVRPPHGARVDYLPPYARELWLGGALFYQVADTYYQYLQDSGGYVVVEPPQTAPMPAPVQGSGYDVIAYPAYGQTPQQLEQDRYQCHRWAVEQSGFDPASAATAPPQEVARTYRRALGACLGGRGYGIN